MPLPLPWLQGRELKLQLQQLQREEGRLRAALAEARQRVHEATEAARQARQALNHTHQQMVSGLHRLPCLPACLHCRF